MGLSRPGSYGVASRSTKELILNEPFNPTVWAEDIGDEDASCYLGHAEWNGIEAEVCERRFSQEQAKIEAFKALKAKLGIP